MTAYEQQLLETAKRREIYVHFEANLSGLKREEVQKAIKSLLRRKLIYTSTRAAKNYYGSGFAGYRAN
jgi:DNA topoisomerase VI subunit B